MPFLYPLENKIRTCEALGYTCSSQNPLLETHLQWESMNCVTAVTLDRLYWLHNLHHSS